MPPDAPRRPPLILVLVVLPIICWAWIVVMARDMYGPMTGASAWMMTPRWDPPHLALLWAMWAVMMTGMMLPSATPMILLASGTAARRAEGLPAPVATLLLASGYLTAWAVFSLGATALQWWLATLFVITPMMEVSGRTVGAAFLVIAGLYQWTPWKRACLITCQSPVAFLMRRWRSGRWGAIRMGAEHGAYCVGCCWALMLLLFVGGVMNVAVIAALTAFVAFEKLTPLGVYGARISGGLLLAAGAWMYLGR